MTEPAIFWDPKGMGLDSLGAKKHIRITDGDTSYVSVGIRMLSIDTPEVHYPGNASPVRQDQPLAQLAAWISQGKAPIYTDLAAFLHPKLSTGNAGTLQKQQGVAATQAFEQLLQQRLAVPNSNRQRKVYLRAADQPFDQYGRLLAYVAPNYTAAERASMSRRERASFNLLMVASGWAAPFPIYPGLPRHLDLKLFQGEVRDAVANRKGAWADPLSLTGYEFRMCVRLYKVTSRLERGQRLSQSERYSWITRYCVDMSTREIHYPQDYHKVEPYNRIFVWPEDVNDAVGKLNLIPAV
jgi:endonuclease YncB( thermonuclease family)